MPATSLQKQYQSGTVAAGTIANIPMTAAFMPGTMCRATWW